jgi:hypothetical protein
VKTPAAMFSGRSAGAIVMTASSLIRRNMGAAPMVKSGSFLRTFQSLRGFALSYCLSQPPSSS